MDLSTEDILSAIESANVGHAITDRNGTLLYCSPSFSKYTDLSVTPGKPQAPWFELDPAPTETHQFRKALWDFFIASGERWQGVVRWHVLDGSIRYFEGTAILKDDNRVVLVVNDLTDRIEVDRSLKKTEEIQRQVLAVLPLSICVVEPDGKISYINEYLPRRLNRPRSEYFGHNVDDAFGPGLDKLPKTVFQKAIETKSTVNGGIVQIESGPLQNSHWLVLGQAVLRPNGDLDNILVIAVDRTDSTLLREERAQFAEAIHESQKISAINDFAGSLAHELSNLLHPIAAYARLLANRPDHPDRAQFASKMNNAAMSAGRILRRTLTMSRTDKSSVTDIDIGSIVQETVDSAREFAPPRLAYHFSPPDKNIIAHAQRGELRQVLLNLFNNAAEAMHYQGDIDIRIEPNLPPPTQTEDAPDTPSSFTRISVKDNGPGMTAEVKARIFEPFFTTKPQGRGTGLGLPVVQGLVTRWGGALTVDTVLSSGTTFHVWIPEQGVRE